MPVTRATFSLAMEKTASVEINLSCTNTHPSVMYNSIYNLPIGLCEY